MASPGRPDVGHVVDIRATAGGEPPASACGSAHFRSGGLTRLITYPNVLVDRREITLLLEHRGQELTDWISRMLQAVDQGDRSTLAQARAEVSRLGQLVDQLLGELVDRWEVGQGSFPAILLMGRNLEQSMGVLYQPDPETLPVQVGTVQVEPDGWWSGSHDAYKVLASSPEQAAHRLLQGVVEIAMSNLQRLGAGSRRAEEVSGE